MLIDKENFLFGQPHSRPLQSLRVDRKFPNLIILILILYICWWYCEFLPDGVEENW